MTLIASDLKTWKLITDFQLNSFRLVFIIIGGLKGCKIYDRVRRNRCLIKNQYIYIKSEEQSGEHLPSLNMKSNGLIIAYLRVVKFAINEGTTI